MRPATYDAADVASIWTPSPDIDHLKDLSRLRLEVDGELVVRVAVLLALVEQRRERFADRFRPFILRDGPVVVRVHLRQGLVEQLRIQEVLELWERTCA